MVWKLKASIGPLTFTVTEGDSDHVDAGGAVAGDAWLVDSLRVGWRFTDTPPAKPEPLTASLRIACHPPALLRELDEGQVIELEFSPTGSFATSADVPVYFAGRVGAPLTVSTAERNGARWGFAQIDATAYDTDLDTLTLTHAAIPVQSPMARLFAIDGLMSADSAGVGLVDPGGNVGAGGAMFDGQSGYGLQMPSAEYGWRLPAVDAGRHTARELLDGVLDNIAGNHEYLGGRGSYIYGNEDVYARDGFPFVVPVVNPAAGQLLGFMCSAHERLTVSQLLPATLGLVGGVWQLVEATGGSPRYLTAGEVETAGAWVRDRATTRVTATHGGAGDPATVTLYDPTAGDTRIVSRDLSTALTDWVAEGFYAAELAAHVARSRMPLAPFDRLGWALDSFVWHPINPAGVRDVLAAAIPDHRDTTSWQIRDVLSQPWIIAGVDPDLSMSEAGRDDYAGTLTAADFLLQPRALRFDYALSFALRRRVPTTAPAPTTYHLSAANMTGALAGVTALNLDPTLTFTDLYLVRKP